MIYFTFVEVSIFIAILGSIVFMFLFTINYIDDYKCKKSIQTNSLTFYKAFSKIKSRKKRKAIYAVYDFCRYADDLVDEYQDEEKLNKLEKDLIKHISGTYVNSYRFRALKRHTYKLYDKDDYQAFFDMIKGQKMDLHGYEYKTLDDLLTYSYYVAGTVGLMLVPILAYKDKKELKDFAIHLGYGMQITNILRDIGEDYKLNRIYIPKDMMDKAKYTIDDLKSGTINNEFKVLFEKLAHLAETYFNEALQKIDLFPKDSRKPLAYSIILYKAILDQCRASDYDVFSKKNFVSDEKKIEIIKAYEMEIGA